MTSKPWFIVAFMVGIALVFGSAVTGIYLGAADVLERNAEFLRQRALITVFDYGDPDRLDKAAAAAMVRERVAADEVRTDPQTGRQFSLLKAYEDAEQTRLRAYGMPFRGMGFWGPVQGILAVSPDLSRTLGLVILEQTETPGLGGRIEEPIFTEQFRAGIAIAANPSGPVLRIAPTGSPNTDGRHVDAISGATQTCMAMERLLNDHLESLHRAMAETRQDPPMGRP